MESEVSHSHRGFSPVTFRPKDLLNRFNGFGAAERNKTVETAMTYLTQLADRMVRCFAFAPKGLRPPAQGCRFGYPGI
jgi:hypothetical protein